jgi:hypothetical protein
MAVEFHGRIAATMVSSKRGYTRRFRLHRVQRHLSGNPDAGPGRARTELAVLLVRVWIVGVRIASLRLHAMAGFDAEQIFDHGQHRR